MLINDGFPTLQSCTRLAEDVRVYDVKFYPYATTNDDQVFAATAGSETFVCRPKLGADPPFEILRWFRDEEDDVSFNSLCWTKHPVTRKPLLCVAGETPKHIKILDVESGRVVRTLPGHGRGINDLVISPLSTSLLASAAEDFTIRLWNLEPKYERQPCVALFAGEGHKSPVLALRFHPNGKWILSGGIDNAVCLWAVPDMEELERYRKETSEYPQPKIIYYPHFFSKEVHSNFVDCFDFYGDLIFSRAARDPGYKPNEILLWKIDGFDADEPPPADPPVPRPGESTRSSFPHDGHLRGFQRVLTFNMPQTDRFYQRFALLHQPGMRPILVMGNQASRFYFWDLQRLEEGIDAHSNPKTKASRGRKPAAFPSEARSVASASSATTTPVPADRVYTLEDRFLPLEPHYAKTANTKLSERQHFGTTQLAWSPDGTWLIGVGDSGLMCLFHRDRSAVGPAGVR